MLYSWSPRIVAREESIGVSRKHLDFRFLLMYACGNAIHEGIGPCDAKRKKMRSSGQLFRVCWPSSAENTATSLSGIMSL